MTNPQLESASNTSRPKVSVIVDVGDERDVLEGAIKSVIEQSCTDFELIVTVSTGLVTLFAMAERYAERDPRIRATQSGSPSGTAQRWNEGLALARGLSTSQHWPCMRGYGARRPTSCSQTPPHRMPTWR